MRIDLYLKVCRLANSRSAAQRLCDGCSVRIDGTAVKASKELHGGEIIELELHGKIKRIRVLSIPENKQVSRSESKLLFSTLD